MATAPAPSPLRLVFAVGGGLAFAGSLLYFAERYLRGFGLAAPPGTTALEPILVNIALFTAFALHHTAFARSGVKQRLAAVIPPALERSTYVWIASLAFVGVCAAWRPVPGELWRTEGWVAGAFSLAQAAAGVFTLVAARRLDVLDLAGVRQALALRAPARNDLDTHGPYGLVRHPIYLAWLVLVWAAPVMTGTRLVFAAVSSLYLVVAVPFEERDLRKSFGAAYEDYARRVRSRILPGIY